MVMNEQTDIFIDILSKKAETNEEFDIVPKINACTLDIICGNKIQLKLILNYNKFSQSI
jgi:hypothetical protein